MKAKSIKAKHLKLNQAKIDKVKRILRTKIERETIERTLDLVIAEDEIDNLLKAVRGKGMIKKVFR